MAIDPKITSVFSRLDPVQDQQSSTTDNIDYNYLWSLAKKYPSWNNVPPEDQKLFALYAIREGFKSDHDAFEYLREKITPLDDKTQALADIEAASSRLNEDLIASLVLKYQENQERLRQEITAKYPNATPKYISQILAAYRFKQAALIRTQALSEENQAEIETAVKASNPKQAEPASDFERAADYITDTAIDATNIPFSVEERQLAAENLIAVSLTMPEQLAEQPAFAVEVALASANSKYATGSQSAVADLYRQIDAEITVTDPDTLLKLALPLQLSSTSTLTASLLQSPQLMATITSGQITPSWLEQNLPPTAVGDSIRAALIPSISPLPTNQTVIDTSAVPKQIYIQPRPGTVPSIIQEGDTLTIVGDVTTEWINANVPLTEKGLQIRQALAETASLPELPPSATNPLPSVPTSETQITTSKSQLGSSSAPATSLPDTITRDWVIANFPGNDPESLLLREALLEAINESENHPAPLSPSPNQSPIINPETNTTFTLPANLPSEEALDASTTRFAELLTSSDPDLLDRTLILSSALDKVRDDVAGNPHVAEIVANSSSAITAKFANNLLSAIREDLPDLNPRAFPSQSAATASAIAKGLNDPASAHSIDLFSQLTAHQLSQAIDHAIANPGSKLGKMYAKDPAKFITLLEKYNELSDSTLGSEITSDSKSPPRKTLAKPESGGFLGLNHLSYGIKSKLGAFGTRATSFVNNKVSRLPVIGKLSQYVFHPVQAFKHWVGNHVGQVFARQIVDQVGQKIIAKIGNEFAKKALENIIKIGIKETLKKGATSLAATAAASLGADAALAATGIGAPVAAVLLVVQVASAVFKLLKAPIDKASELLWGDKIRGRDIVMIPALVAGAAATSGAVVLLISAIIAGFLYLAAFNIAPIIGSLAITGEFKAPGTSATTPGRSAIVPPSVNLTANCPSGVPTQPAFPIMQGPRVGSHTIQYSYFVGGRSYPSEGEAVDYGTPAGTGIFSTHNGTAYFFSEGTPGMAGLGNFVVVTGTCEGNPFLTLYGHMQPLPYAAGTAIPIGKGSLLGNSGNSGSLGDGYHLHYEIFGLGDIYRYL